MALKTTQMMLKTKFRAEIKKLKFAIFAKCYNCMGFHADKVYDCGMKGCALYNYRLKKSLSRLNREAEKYIRTTNAKKGA